jgi:hypothetical protein
MRDNPMDLLAAAAEEAARLARGVREDQLTNLTPCPDYDVRAMLRHLLQEVVLHSWDLAKATGQRVTYSAEAADAVLRLLEDRSDPMRQDDWYAPPVPVHDTADPLERAVARSGRDPGWLPPPRT